MHAPCRVCLVESRTAGAVPDPLEEQPLRAEGLLAGHDLLDRGRRQRLKDKVRTAETQPWPTPVRLSDRAYGAGVEVGDVVRRAQQPGRLLGQPLRARPPAGDDDVVAGSYELLQPRSVRTPRGAPPASRRAAQRGVSRPAQQWGDASVEQVGRAGDRTLTRHSPGPVARLGGSCGHTRKGRYADGSSPHRLSL